MKNFIRQNYGFSLIEVAIAVVVIGLIASFTLKGKELINSAKLRSVPEQVNVFKVAVQGFVDKYGALPGDFSKAREMINDSLTNGPGKGSISSLDDAKRFWQHLVASDLICIELVNGYPTSKMGGYYTVSSNIPGRPGSWIILCRETSDNQNFIGVLSPSDAYFIDKNNDTGNPTTGEIQAIKSVSASGECFIGSEYNLKNKNKDCVIMFRIW
ncbi:MAG: prepilin-type N-terminal cleavage/methylation domain-containing protein [Holosporaceae bacterium]|jgi:prepilin-type N-terminal cleavage/methylation domain-containing protein|nr:prepilin-type N-terminal cleavage/methylation domain-containing protein [Holosporaceae bacterium]